MKKPFLTGVLLDNSNINQLKIRSNEELRQSELPKLKQLAIKRQQQQLELEFQFNNIGEQI